MSGYTTSIFDLDGTLLDTLQDLHLTLNHALGSQGLAPHTIAETRSLLGDGIRRLVERAVPADTDAATLDAVFTEFNHTYAAHCNDHTHPYPGIRELVRELRAEGRRVAVASNKSDYAVQELMAIHFPGALDACLGVSDQIARKPARDMVDAVLAKMGPAATADAAQGRAVYVGDSEVDVACARNATIPCISVAWGFRDVDQLQAAGATTIVTTVEELAAAIRGGTSQNMAYVAP